MFKYMYHSILINKALHIDYTVNTRKKRLIFFIIIIIIKIKIELIM